MTFCDIALDIFCFEGAYIIVISGILYNWCMRYWLFKRLSFKMTFAFKDNQYAQMKTLHIISIILVYVCIHL